MTIVHSAARARHWRTKTLENPAAHPLALARIRRDLTQRELGELSGVSSDVISRVERRIYGSTPLPKTKAAIAAALATDEELFPE